MSDQSDTPTGVLRVDVDETSHFLSDNLPLVVRDAHHVVVHRGTCGSSTELPEGLYSVAVLTPDGERAHQLAQIREDATTSLTFKPPDAIPESATGLPAPRPRPTTPLPPTPPFATGVEPTTRGETTTFAEPPDHVAVISTDRCTARLRDEAGWEFVPTEPLDAVPSAEFTVGNRRVKMSLPLNPHGPYPLNSCRVNVDTTGDSTKLRMAFATGRRVTRMVDGLVRHHEIAAGSAVLDEATNLLIMKYADPPGAALGGLTLHRLGLLQERREWIENLARDFTWLTDGLVLLAALLRHQPDAAERRRGLDLLLAASQQRPMYTDGLSLALELLRRWPSKSTKDQRYDALDRLADYSAYADWDSVNLSVELSA